MTCTRSHNSLFGLALLAGAFGTALPASAEMISQPTHVVELFTSQGCSSCPPANATVVSLDETREDVLSLSYGVTYWDYLGWKDTFGDPQFTERQKNYDSVMMSGVYTPMIVVGGDTHAPRLNQARLENSPVPAGLKVSRESGELCIDGDLPRGTMLAVVNYQPGTQDVAVKRGENTGRTLRLANVVTGLDYKNWDGQMICGLRTERGLAVLAHDPDSSALIGAVRIEP
jgi:hypothetical protein